MPSPPTNLPRIVADSPLSAALDQLLAERVEVLGWDALAALPVGKVDETVEAIFTYNHPTVDGPLMDRAPRLRVISNFGVGVDHIDLAAAAKRGIVVGNTPDVLSGATADMGWSLLMAAARRVAEGSRYARGESRTRYDGPFPLGREVHGQTLGVVGMGRIGEQVARRAAGFNMRILYHNRRRNLEAEARTGATYKSLDELLSEADFVVICAPLTDETLGMIGAAQLNRMKPTAILVNIARGAVVDTDALTNALSAGRIWAAGLDVTEPEPLPAHHPLWAMDNVVITPHLGSATVQTRQRMAEVAVENLLAGLAGKPLVHRVDGTP